MAHTQRGSHPEAQASSSAFPILTALRARGPLRPVEAMHPWAQSLRYMCQVCDPTHGAQKRPEYLPHPQVLMEATPRDPAPRGLGAFL